MNESDFLSRIESLFQKYAFLNKDTLTIEEASRFTGLTTGTLKNYVFQKKIGAFKPGVGHSAKLYFDKRELEQYMRQNRILSDMELESQAATFTFKKQSA